MLGSPLYANVLANHYRNFSCPAQGYGVKLGNSLPQLVREKDVSSALKTSRNTTLTRESLQTLPQRAHTIPSFTFSNKWIRFRLVFSERLTVVPIKSAFQLGQAILSPQAPISITEAGTTFHTWMATRGNRDLSSSNRYLQQCPETLFRTGALLCRICRQTGSLLR